MKTVDLLMALAVTALLSGCVTSRRTSANPAESRVVVVIVPMVMPEADYDSASPKPDPYSLEMAVLRQPQKKAGPNTPAHHKASMKVSAPHPGGI
jgi:hypothetical protein